MANNNQRDDSGGEAATMAWSFEAQRPTLAVSHRHSLGERYPQQWHGIGLQRNVQPRNHHHELSTTTTTTTTTDATPYNKHQ
jgi:hypothetical protein